MRTFWLIIISCFVSLPFAPLWAQKGLSKPPSSLGKLSSSSQDLALKAASSHPHRKEVPLTHRKKAQKVKKTNKNTNLSTDLQFNTLLVNGKYQVPQESLIVVEDEKSLEDLLGLRRNFRDRMNYERSRR